MMGAVKGGEGRGEGRTMKFGQLGSRGEGQQDYFELLCCWPFKP
jgi:hypothetical protein